MYTCEFPTALVSMASGGLVGASSIVILVVNVVALVVCFEGNDVVNGVICMCWIVGTLRSDGCGCCIMCLTFWLMMSEAMSIDTRLRTVVR